ncbi:hypothetical protein JAAARDRAFT_31105 [Jaapia argillacea MUCL 33604]|uniref:Mus7/MMS22 family-domain-containing protein n=1 Tax=Jaapia argillacea MUCL 33604 TaxID=933084 RepID=A0A067QDQ6_9AGAM|nr:hypothetical protein JAAARDRAFT_31105 [Jaapia argillacea MUCL 33604]
MDVEIVETSDSEERELAASNSSAYWRQYLSTHSATSHEPHNRPPNLLPLQLDASTFPVLRSRHSPLSPRKRIKLAHPSPSQLRSPPQPPNAGTPPPTSPNLTPNTAPSSRSPRSSSRLPTPVPSPDVPQYFVDVVSRDEEEDPLYNFSQDELCSALRDQSLMHPKPGTGPRARPFAGAAPSTPPLLRQDSRPSVSPDPLCLFSSPPQPPRRQDETPNRTSLPVSAADPSAPPTALHSRSSLALPESSPLSSVPDQEATEATVNHEGPVELDVGVRYSLRARNAKQLHPYRHDQANYKMQMRSNPDAIVRVVSPTTKRHHHHTEPGHDQDEESQNSMADWVVSSVEEERGRGRGVERRRSKSANRGEDHPAHASELDSTSERGKRRTRISLSTSHDPLRHLRNEVHDVPSTSSDWHPAIFDELSSSEDETQDESKSGARSVVITKAVRRQGRLRPRPAPSPPPWQSRSPTDPSPISHIFHDSVGDDQVEFLDRKPHSEAGHGPSPSPPPTSRYSMDFDRDSDSALDSRSEREGAANSSTPPLDESRRKQRNERKILGKMMPAVMVAKVLRRSPAPIRRSVSLDTRGSESEDEGQRPVLPGHSRTRVVSHPRGKSHAPILGDPDSSDHVQPSSDSSSDSGVEPLLGPVVRRTGSDDSDTPNSDHEDVQHNTVEFPHTPKFYRKKKPRPRETIVDYMLNGKQKVGPTRRRSRSPHPRSRPRLHIVTAGARRDAQRQTRLSFQPLNSIGSPEDDNSEALHERQEHVPVEMYMRRRKARRPPKSKNTYTFAHSGGGIQTGSRRAFAMTIDLEDDSIHTALDPRRGDPHTTIPKRNPAHRSRYKPVSTINRSKGQTSLGFEVTGEASQLDAVSQPRALAWEEAEHSALRNISSDCNIPMFRSGIAFPSQTYLGKGWLHDLCAAISGQADPLQPNPFTAFGFQFPMPSIRDLTACLPPFFDKLHEVSLELQDLDQFRKYEALMHVLCQTISWASGSADDSAYELLHTAAREQVHRFIPVLCEQLSNIHSVQTQHLALLWFCTELSMRAAYSSRRKEESPDALLSHVAPLISCLLRVGIRAPIETLLASDASLDDTVPTTRVAEIWICLLHLADVADKRHQQHDPSCQSSLIWQAILRDLEVEERTTVSDLERSEAVWTTIFGLCALSQFSLHGMTTSKPRAPNSWDLVCHALQRIRLTAESETERNLSTRSLKKRDGYIRLILTRCLVLHKTWHWGLEHASRLFNHLVEIFKSRKFTNLLIEEGVTDFPRFLRHTKWQLLEDSCTNDTAFTMFLKLIAHAVQGYRSTHPEDPIGLLPPPLKKLLSLAIPLGSVPFTKANPPLGRDLSMLYNRFSAIAVALYLEPNVTASRHRLAIARRYVAFKDADFTTRAVCIRAVMYFCIVSQHLSLPIEELLNWLTEMTDILVDEYQAASVGLGDVVVGPSDGEPRSRTVLSIQMLLGSVRRIIETPSMSDSATGKGYPNPALLEGPWVTRVFATSTNLANGLETGVEIRRLVQAFLDARAAIMPTPSKPKPAIEAVDRQESQDEYDQFDFNLDDPELQAALGELDEPSRWAEHKREEERVLEVVDRHISPAIYRLVCKHVVSPSQVDAGEDQWNSADEWIDCWVGCASIIVQNGKRDWSMYLTLGAQSWEKIIEPFWRRRVGVRFMYKVLQLDPSAYVGYQDRFMEAFSESLVSADVTSEHKYISLVLAVDGLHHPLLRGISWLPTAATFDHELSKTEFLSVRLSLIKGICLNLSELLHREADGDLRIAAQNQRYVGFIVVMFSAVKDNLERKGPSVGQYTHFCSELFSSLRDYHRLRQHSRISPFFQWSERLAAS